MTRLLIRFYPADWQRRYGDEFEALLDGRPTGPSEIGNVLAILGILAFSGGWVWLGISALRAERAALAGPGAILP